MEDGQKNSTRGALPPSAELLATARRSGTRGRCIALLEQCPRNPVAVVGVAPTLVGRCATGRGGEHGRIFGRRGRGSCARRSAQRRWNELAGPLRSDVARGAARLPPPSGAAAVHCGGARPAMAPPRPGAAVELPAGGGVLTARGRRQRRARVARARALRPASRCSLPAEHHALLGQRGAARSSLRRLRRARRRGRQHRGRGVGRRRCDRDLRLSLREVHHARSAHRRRGAPAQHPPSAPLQHVRVARSDVRVSEAAVGGGAASLPGARRATRCCAAVADATCRRTRTRRQRGSRVRRRRWFSKSTSQLPRFCAPCAAA